MGLDWKIDSRARLVTAVADGPVTRADVDRYLDAVDGAGALTYRKLFDATKGIVAMDQEDLLAVGARFRSYHDRPVGPVAIVVIERQADPVGRLLGMLASADRPLRIFTSRLTAQRWLDRLAEPSGSGDTPT
ncbi:MAG: hypothetical protein ACOY4R_11190 [Pseudomonadota bacterium]